MNQPVRTFRRIGLVLAMVLLSSFTTFAQRDLEPLMNGFSLEKLVDVFGQPIAKETGEGEGGDHIVYSYRSFEVMVVEEGSKFDAALIWGNDLRIMSAVVIGGIKIGDQISLYKDIDFPYLCTGRHYEGKGLIPLVEPFGYCLTIEGHTVNVTHRILSEGIPFRVFFEVEDGIIKAMVVDHLADYFPATEDPD